MYVHACTVVSSSSSADVHAHRAACFRGRPCLRPVVGATLQAMHMPPRSLPVLHPYLLPARSLFRHMALLCMLCML